MPAGGGAVGIQKDNSRIIKSVSDINFTGSGVTVTRQGKNVTVNISGGGSPLTGVEQIVAGAGITLSPSSGTGIVTIATTGGDGGGGEVQSLIAGYGITLSGSTGNVTISTLASIKGTQGNIQLANSGATDFEVNSFFKLDPITAALKIPGNLDLLTTNSFITFPDGTTQGTAAYGVMGGTGATGATGPQGNTGATGPTEDSIGIYLDSTPDDLAIGKKGFKQIPYNCQVLEWYVLAGQTGSIEFDVKSGSFAAYPTTTTIVGGDYPKLTSQFKNSNTGVTAWSGLTAGDIIDFVINSNTGIESVGLFIKIRRTS
jgi:hypothetical protein